jgi:hypothetical protein
MRTAVHVQNLSSYAASFSQIDYRVHNVPHA